MSAAADAVALVHVSFVIFVLLGFVAIVVGDLTRARWSPRLWFRVLHVAAVGYTLVRTWLGAKCPLTTLEYSLRGPGNTGGHLAAVCHRLFFNGMDRGRFRAGVTVLAAMVLIEVVWTLVSLRLSIVRGGRTSNPPCASHS